MMAEKTTVSRRPGKSGGKPRRSKRPGSGAAGAWALILRAWAFICGIGALSLFFVWGYHYVVESPYLMLTDIRINGVEETLSGELLLSTGLAGNVSLLALNLKQLRKTIETHPWVSHAQVERRFPHSLHITVEKETPVAVVVLDRLFYMNGRGRIFKTVDMHDQVDFPFVTGVSSLAAESRDQLRRAAYVIASVAGEEPPWSLESLSEIHLGEDGQVSLYYRHLNAEIRMAWNGVEGNMPGLRRVVSHLRMNGRLGRVAAIDFNQENGAVISMRSG